jgi:hypothetical protein
MYYPEEKISEILEEKNGVLFAINIRHYEGVVLDFEVSQKSNTDCEDDNWSECIPSDFSTKEVQVLLDAHIQDMENEQSEESAAAEAARDFERDQRL